MTLYRNRVLLIVQAADQARANQAAASLGSAADLNTFSVGLSPTGALPVSHYWASPALTDAEWAQVQGMQPAFAGSTMAQYDLDGDPTFPDRTLAALGLQRVAP